MSLNGKWTLWKALRVIYFRGNRRINIKQVSPNVYVYNLYGDKPAVEYGEAFDYLYMKHRFVYHVVVFSIFPYKRQQFIERIKEMVRFRK